MAKFRLKSFDPTILANQINSEFDYLEKSIEKINKENDDLKWENKKMKATIKHLESEIFRLSQKIKTY